jgi:2-succinyl-5-enolpyruvyl-6-hydroxy-3-cyclohexene-1-carboxylate synthase
MKKSINLNVLFAEYLVRSLYGIGVRDVVISPGSRSTPLVIAFHNFNKIKKHVVIDERSNAFYALGIAAASKKPVAIVTTSGSAVAELYPAIIEAFYKHIPLIICTADRPERLVDTGSNQTINQKNIYANHIKYFLDTGIIKPNLTYFKNFNLQLNKAFSVSLQANRGPFHLNCRFDKPLEKSIPSHNVASKTVNSIKKITPLRSPKNETIGPEKLKKIIAVIKELSKSKKTILYVGHESIEQSYHSCVASIAKLLDAPIFADGLSGYRLSNIDGENVIINSSAFLRNRDFIKFFDAEIIIQFGNAPTSNILLYFLENSKAKKILINEFGEIKDPSLTFTNLLESSPQQFLRLLKGEKRKINNCIDPEWLKMIYLLESSAQKLKNQIIGKAEFPFEGRIVKELFTAIPAGSNVMISNSIPPRDVDSFCDLMNKKIQLYHNRGTSGIDGIISTAAGLYEANKKPTFLLIGDLSFLHDTNGLWLLNKYKIPLVIILVNNGGGSIFEMLPVVKQKIDFNKYYKVHPEANFGKIVRAFNGNYILIKSWNHFRNNLLKPSNIFKVLEIKSSSKNSLSLRKKFWDSVISGTREIIDEYSNR